MQSRKFAGPALASVSCAPHNRWSVSENRTDASRLVARLLVREQDEMTIGRWIGANYLLLWVMGVCLSASFAAPLLRTKNEGESVWCEARLAGDKRAPLEDAAPFVCMCVRACVVLASSYCKEY